MPNTKTISQLEPADKFRLGKSLVEVISTTPRDHRVRVLELKFLNTGHTELRTFLSHFPINLYQEKK